MKIEITDRQYWLGKVKAEIDRIDAINVEEQADYDACKDWERLPWYVRFRTRKPTLKHLRWSRTAGAYGDYLPTGWKYIWHLHKMVKALESDHTGTIYFTEDEIGYCK